jgi:hypothetical protein
MCFQKIIAFILELKLINIFKEGNTKISNVKAGGTNVCHCGVKNLKPEANLT